MDSSAGNRAILMALNLVPDKLGAYERFMMRFAERSAKEGLSVDFLVAGEPIDEITRSLARSGAGVSILPDWNSGPTILRGPRLARRIAELQGSYHYRLVSFSFCEPLSSLAALESARKQSAGRPKLVWHQHSEQQSPRFISRRISALRLASGLVDRICPVYQKGAEVMRARHIAADKIEVLPNGACACPLPAEKRDRKRGEIGICPGDFALFVAASLIERKNIAMMVRALATALPQAQNLVLTIAGEGHLKAALTDLACGLGVADRVRFLGLRNDVGALVSASDLCLMTSYSEALPFFCIEAFAAGRTIVSTPAGGIPQVVRHGENGILVGFDDDEAMARAIVTLAGDHALRKRYEKKAAETHRSDYTEAQMVEAYFTFYLSLIG